MPVDGQTNVARTRSCARGLDLLGLPDATTVADVALFHLA